MYKGKEVKKMSLKRNNHIDLTLEEVRKQFVDYQKVKGLSDSTISMNNEAIDNFLKLSGLSIDSPIKEITESFFNNFILKLKDRDISISTKNILVSHIRVFLYWCMDNKYIKRFKIHLIKGQQQKIKFFTDEEVNKLLVEPDRNCSFTESRMYTIVCFVMSTGRRVSTLVNIKTEDLDFQNKTITYTHLKNKSSVIIPMSNSLYKVLTKYLKEWERKDNTYLFCGVNELQMTTRSVTHSLYKYCKRRGVKPRGIHSLRHSFARMYIKSGGDPFSLQHILTHSSMEMTKRYVNLFSDDLRESINNFNPLDNIKMNKTKTVYRR